jgi:hypothetical protein
VHERSLHPACRQAGQQTANSSPSWIGQIASAHPLRAAPTYHLRQWHRVRAPHRLHSLDLQTYFCDPYAPWQKGGIENAIGRMRRLIPRKTDLATISDRHFTALLQAYNATPRKCLDFMTPAELFLQHLFHFKCESTSPPARG